MSKLVENALNRIQRDLWKPWRWFLPPGKVMPPPTKKPMPKVKPK